MVKPLLEMKSIPMSIEYKINNAHYEIENVNVPVEITQCDNGYQLKMEPVKFKLDRIDIDNFQVNNNETLDVKNYFHLSKGATYEVSSSYSHRGNIKLDIKLNSTTSKIALRKFESEVNFNLSSWEPQDISIKYDFDNLNFDLNGNKTQFKFVPGNIEFIIKEYPRIEIKYLGDPIYVPASANPNYKLIDKLI